MIVDVFVSERDGENSLDDEVFLLVRDEKRIPWIDDDLVNSSGKLEDSIDPLKEEHPRIRGEFSAVEVDVDFFVVFARLGCQMGGFHGTVCLVVRGEMWLQFHCNVFDDNILPRRPFQENPAP